MKHFTNSLTLAGITALALVSSATAYDEYGPITAGKTEVDAMANYDLSPEAGGLTPSLQVKYGIMDGLDIEVYGAMPTDPKFGFGQPNIAVKYNDAASGFGGFVALDLPFASKKINADPQLGYTFAAQYLKTYDKIVLNDWLKFNSTFQDGDDGTIDLYVKPQYNLSDKLGPYVGVEWKTSGKFEGYTIAIKPGVNYVVNDMISFEGQLPISKTKDVDDLYVGAYVGAYFVF